MEIKTLQVGPIGTNCYLLCDTGAGVCAVIDPGAEASRVAAAVQESGCTPCAILLTHGHYDHTGAVAQLRQMWPQVPVYLSRKDQYDAGTYAAELFPAIPGAVDYGEGDKIAVGNLTVEVLSTPATPRAAEPCAAATCSFAATPSLPAPAAGRTLWAAA